MEKNHTFHEANCCISFCRVDAFALCIPIKQLPRNFCNNEATLWSRTLVPHRFCKRSNIVNLSYQQLGVMNTPGTYRVIDYGDQNPNWHKTPDHTPTIRMAVWLLHRCQSRRYLPKRKQMQTDILQVSTIHFWVLNLMGLGNCRTKFIDPCFKNNCWIPGCQR